MLLLKEAISQCHHECHQNKVSALPVSKQQACWSLIKLQQKRSDVLDHIAHRGFYCLFVCLFVCLFFLLTGVHPLASPCRLSLTASLKALQTLSQGSPEEQKSAAEAGTVSKTSTHTLRLHTTFHQKLWVNQMKCLERKGAKKLPLQWNRGK